MNKYSFLALLALYVLLPSCKRSNLQGDSDLSLAPSDFNQVFEAFWTGMSNNYVYWDIDTTNWDGMHDRYKAIFNDLDLQNPNDVRKSVQYFKEMTSGLIDSHFYIDFTNFSIAGSSIYPAYDRKKQASGYHAPFLYYNVDRHYFDSGSIAGYDSISNPGTLIYAFSGTISHRILYFTCNTFGLFKSYESPMSNGVQLVLKNFFNSLDNFQPELKGVILDLRGNPGGDLSDLNFLIGQFIDKPLIFGYTRHRSGNGRLDYSPWLQAIVTPQTTIAKKIAQVIVLADNYSASLAEAITMAIHTLPNGKFVGETTWGATGPITTQSIYNDGGFSVPGFMSVTMASAEFKYLDGNIYEGKGFPPDIPVQFDITALNAGDDPFLEKAISLFE